MNYYEVLGVAKNATKEAIDAARKKLLKQFHPDLHPEHKEEYTKKTAQINEAYATLSDEKKKRKYDEELGGVIVEPTGRTPKPHGRQSGPVINPNDIEDVLRDLGI